MHDRLYAYALTKLNGILYVFQDLGLCLGNSEWVIYIYKRRGNSKFNI